MTITQRNNALRQMLTERRSALEDDVHARLREGRAAAPVPGRDDMEQSDDNIRGDLAFALLQIKSESLAQLEAALLRLDAGKYGDCATCERPIAKARLAVLPFAVRCQPCAQRLERAPVTSAAAPPWDAPPEPDGFRG